LLAKLGQILPMMVFVMAIFNAPSASAADGVEVNGDVPQAIWEHVLYEDIKQGPGSHAFFKMTVGKRYYTGTQHLAIKAMADAFESDPDVYISNDP
jgi:hypothetical protein